MTGPTRAQEENVEAIRRWEQEALHNRSTTEQFGDWVVRTAASGPALILHVAWFGFWALVNTGLLPGVRPFDPFPFPVLTMLVSLEAIFLSLVVLTSQNRLSRQADKRAHLDLQINLLAEREMTVVLQLLQDIAAHLDVKVSVTSEQIRDLAEETDIHALAQEVDGVAEPTADTKPGSGAVR